MGTPPHRRGSEFESHVDDERLESHPAMVAVQAVTRRRRSSTSWTTRWPATTAGFHAGD